MMKASWEWEIDGHKVPPNRVAEALSASVLRSVEKDLVAKISGVRCPEHGKGPTNVQVTKAGGELRFAYGCCCDRLEGAIQAALK